MKELVFATNNPNKLKEIGSLLSNNFKILSLKDVGFEGDIPETQETLEGNASQKAFHIYNKFKINVFADDTGLEIKAINNRPGVYSARYAGESCKAQDNIKKVLNELKDENRREATFRTIISLIINGQEIQFEGRVEGKITEMLSGDEGFGYDPIFIPKGFDCTFAQMSLDQKNEVSHRAQAVKKLAAYLLRNR